MSNSGNPWEQLSSDLSDGKPMDWDSIASTHPKDKDLIEQLKSIQTISTILSGGASKQDPSDSTQRDVLFDWGHLQIIEPIGSGSFGEVFRAYDSILDREVALKLLKTEQLAAFQSNAFIAEARRIAKVRHPNVLAVHGASTHNNRVGLWADLIEGDTLSEYLEHCTFSAQELIRVIQELSWALKTVHQAQLIHGDIKPSNVMRDQNGHYVLMDFGAGFDQQKQMNQQRNYTGTPLLMAPELFQGRNKSTQSDIYAFGALLFKLTTNQYPIEADNIADVRQAHQDKAYLKLNLLRKDLPPSLQQLIHSMLATDPEQRPSADEISQRIERIITAPQRRNKRLALAAILATLVLGITFSSIGFYRANEARKIAQQEQQKAEAVNNFLSSMLESASELGDGKNTRVVDLLDFAVKNAPEDFIDQPHALASVYAAVGRSYASIKSYQSALESTERSIELSKKLLGPHAIDTLALQVTRAEILNNLDQFEEAQNLLKQTIALAQKQEGDYKHVIQLANIRLAGHLERSGKKDDALRIYQDLLNNLDDPQTAINNHSFLVLLNTANLYHENNQFELAEDFAIQALDWIDAYSEFSEINKMAARNTASIAMIFQGKENEAEPYFRANVEAAKTVYGEDNAGYLGPIMNLSNLLHNQGQYEESLSLQQKAAQLSQDLFGENDRKTIRAHMNLANILVSVGQLEQGEEMMRSTLNTAISELGENNMQSIMLGYNLAELLNNTQRYDEAERLARNNYSITQETLGHEHPFTWLDLDNIAVSLSGKKRFNEALDAHNQCIDQLIKIVGEKNPYTLVALKNKINTLHASGDTQSALIELENLITLQTEVFGLNDQKTQESIKQQLSWAQ